MLGRFILSERHVGDTGGDCSARHAKPGDIYITLQCVGCLPDTISARLFFRLG